LVVGFAFQSLLGPDQFLPSAAALGATGKRPAEPAKGFVALLFNGSDL
jgi:hypothetical protein